jgi:predicted transcriptional regulator
MTTVFQIDGDSIAAMKFIEYARTLPFVTEQSTQDAFEPIPNLAYTDKERIASVLEGMEDIKAGRTYTTAEVFKPYEQWL